MARKAAKNEMTEIPTPPPAPVQYRTFTPLQLTALSYFFTAPEIEGFKYQTPEEWAAFMSDISLGMPLYRDDTDEEITEKGMLADLIARMGGALTLYPAGTKAGILTGKEDTVVSCPKAPDVQRAS